jgi:hypothetical protein
MSTKVRIVIALLVVACCAGWALINVVPTTAYMACGAVISGSGAVFSAGSGANVAVLNGKVGC